MSWFNLNDSFNNIKGQITSLASEVLAEGTGNNTESSEAIRELQELITRKETEIQALKNENDLLKLHQSSRSVKENEAGNDDGWSWDLPETQENANAVIADLRKQIDELDAEKKDLLLSLDQLDLDCQEATDKLVTLKDELQLEHNKLKLDFAELQQKNGFLVKINEENQKRIKALESGVAERNAALEEKLLALKTDCENFKNVELLKLRRKFEEVTKVTRKLQILRESANDSLQSEDCARLESILHEYETKLSSYENEMSALKKSNSKLEQQVSEQQNSIQVLIKEKQDALERLEHALHEERNHGENNAKLEVLAQENAKLSELLNAKNLELQQHKKAENEKQAQFEKERSNIANEIESLKGKHEVELKDANKRFSEEKQTSAEEIRTLKLKIEEQSKSTAEASLSEKCASLEKTIADLRSEKNHIITEKNGEIEKLIRNSDELSNEILLKAQDLKHYEEECADLIKNNELLIARLEEYKNSSNLETISETNEENMLQLEHQLESANKRNEELMRELQTKAINSEDGDAVVLRLELLSKSEELNDALVQLDEFKRKYDALIKSYEQLETDNDSLKLDLNDMRVNYVECYSEREDLNQTVDQMKSECENTEYKYAEQNINLETLKEEIETNQLKIDELSAENKRLEALRVDFEGKNELMAKEIEDLKQELTATLDVLEEKDKALEEMESNVQESARVSQKLKEAEVVNGNLNARIEELLNEDMNNNVEEMQRARIEELLKQNAIIGELKEAAEKNCNRFSIDVTNYHNKIADLSKTCDGLVEQNKMILTENARLKEEVRNAEAYSPKTDALHDEIKKLNSELLEKTNQLDELNLDYGRRQSIEHEKIRVLEEQLVGFDKMHKELSDSLKMKQEENAALNGEIQTLRAQLADLTQSNNQVIEFVQAKHKENESYHGEIQRLQQLLTIEIEKSKTYENQMQTLNTTSITAEEISKKDEEMEKLCDQNNFLREKCAKLAENLLEEQSNVQKVLSERAESSEKEMLLQRKLEELRRHMVEVEDYYTKEVSNAELACEEMKKKLVEMEQREKNSSNRYTSVNIRANQQVETLQTQLQLVTNQRDELKGKISDQEDEINKQKAALTNLHSAFQQFQREKDKQIQIETERIRRQLAQEKQTQEILQKDIGDLKGQLDESKEGLKAAVRLSDQVDASKRQVTAMKEEVAKLQQQLIKSEEKYNKHFNQGDGKVDKMLIKNLIIGLVSSNNNLTKDQNQILKIISTVLDFNQLDIEKVKLNKNQSNSWFASLLHPQSLEGQSMTQESLSLAFVKFLEAESKPRELPNLLDSASAVPEGKPSSGRTSSVRQSPILLNEIVLPTFADFAQNRNSSSILKDVLKDNNTNS